MTQYKRLAGVSLAACSFLVACGSTFDTHPNTESTVNIYRRIADVLIPGIPGPDVMPAGPACSPSGISWASQMETISLSQGVDYFKLNMGQSNCDINIPLNPKDSSTDVNLPNLFIGMEITNRLRIHKESSGVTAYFLLDSVDISLGSRVLLSFAPFNPDIADVSAATSIFVPMTKTDVDMRNPLKFSFTGTVSSTTTMPCQTFDCKIPGVFLVKNIALYQIVAK